MIPFFDVWLNAYDLNFVTHPVRRQVYPSTVAAGLDPLFDHLFPIDLKFDLVAAGVFAISIVIDGLDVIN